MDQSLLKVKQRCPVGWESMQGDDKRRFCGQCQKYVHNVSALNQKERQALTTGDGLQECVYYIENSRGEIADLSLLVTFRRWFPSLRLASWSAVMALLPVTLTGCAGKRCPEPTPSATTHSYHPPEHWKAPSSPQKTESR